MQGDDDDRVGRDDHYREEEDEEVEERFCSRHSEPGRLSGWKRRESERERARERERERERETEHVPSGLGPVRGAVCSG